ncbi:MAG: surface antigen [Flaviaesturariibacter sp.]|nr:surface antigen [Flaviaesturariibacter sp.]
MVGVRLSTFLLAGCLLAGSCNTLKYVPKDDALYTGAKINIKGTDASARERKLLRSDLGTLTRPKPNSRFLGIPFKLLIYNAFNGKKENSFLGRIGNKLGEPPVLLSQLDLNKNVKVLQNYSENKGFFHAKVSGDTTVKRRRATAVYTVEAGVQYKIKSLRLESDSTVLTQKIGETMPKSLLKVGQPFDLDVIKTERSRIDAYLKENGFYYFSPEFLLFKVDSTVGSNMVDLILTVKPSLPTVAKEVYHINDVVIYSDYSLNTARIDTSKAGAKLYKGYYIVDKDNKYKPWLFEQSMQFKPGEVYNRADHNLTLSRLINLNLFKYTKNRFEPTPDSPLLNVYYYLTPLPKKSLRAELTGINKSNNSNGTELTVSWRNRNAFRGGEQLSLSAYIGTEIQAGGNRKGYNTYRTGAEATLALPKFLVPFVDLRNAGAFAPRTILQVGFDVLNKNLLYTLNSFRGRYGYTWKEDITKQHEFYPIDVNYVQPFSVTREYDSLAKTNSALRKATERQFILGSTYRFTYDRRLKGLDLINSFYFSGLADVSGNLASLVKRGNVEKGDTAMLFNAPYAQYIKLETDFRYYRKLGLKSTWANRILIGYGNPYGNSSQLPFIKQFFSGGNSSIRAFRSRTLGPGTYRDTSDYLVDQTGDIKLEFNTEYRPHISGPLYGAVFVDAGNIWLKNEDPNRPGSGFSKNYLKELAVGAGVGIRLDIVVFVIRLDVAIPLRKPWEQNPWVMRQIALSDPVWRRENLIYNLAIGYPF